MEDLTWWKKEPVNLKNISLGIVQSDGQKEKTMRKNKETCGTPSRVHIVGVQKSIREKEIKNILTNISWDNPNFIEKQ